MIAATPGDGQPAAKNTNQDAGIMTGELAPARHVLSAATAAGNQDQIYHMVQRW
jgi:hypothetical protein